MTDKGEKPEFDDGSGSGPPWKVILPVIEKMMAQFAVAGRGITFTITREELYAHLVERSRHYFAEIERLSDPKVVPFDVEKEWTRLGRYQRQPGMPPFDMPKAVETIRVFKIEQAKVRARVFEFAALHLADAPAFSIDVQAAAAWELLPSDAVYALLDRGAGPHLAGTLAPFGDIG